MRLIDADALMAAAWGNYTLKDAVKYGNATGEQANFSHSSIMMYEVADMIEDMPTVMQWLTCSERLPDKTGWYIVCDAGIVTVAFWNNNQQYFNQSAPRYWQPLPQAPEEG